jgi:hypothetical protein
MGLFAVAHLAARHNIQVELHSPATGGTVAQVRLPASLTSREAAAGGRPRAGAGLRMARPRGPQYVPSRFASGPVPDPPLLTAALDGAALDGAALDQATLDRATADRATLTAASAGTGPRPAGTGPNVIIPPADGPPQGSGLPIYASLESDWFRARGRGAVRRDETWAGAPAGEPPHSWTSPGDDGWRAAAASTTPATGGTTAAGLPRRVPQANLVPGSASDQQTRTATMAEAAEIARSRLANFQRGSRRARSTARQLTPGD